MAAAHGQMQQLAGWLGAHVASGQGLLTHREGVAIAAVAGDSDAAQLLPPPPQKAALRWAGAQKAALDQLQLLLVDTADLLEVCVEAGAVQHDAAHTALLRTAAAQCCVWRGKVTAAKAQLDAQLGGLPVALATPAAADSAGGLRLWVPPSAWATVSYNYQLLQSLATEAHSWAAEHARAAIVPGSGAGKAVPGWAPLLSALDAAAQQALEFASDSSSLPQAQHAKHVAGGDVAVGSTAHPIPQAGSATQSSSSRELNQRSVDSVEGAVTAALLWAQGVSAAATGCKAQLDAALAALDSSPCLPVPTQATAGGLAQWQQGLEAAVQLPRAQSLVAAVCSALAELGVIADRMHAGCDPEDSLALQEVRQMQTSRGASCDDLAMIMFCHKLSHSQKLASQVRLVP